VLEGRDEITLMLLLGPSLHSRRRPEAASAVDRFVQQNFLSEIRSRSL